VNSEELKIYTALTHPVAPESYRVTDNGTRLYVLINGVLAMFGGEALDEMTPNELYAWYQNRLEEYRQQNYWV
jgi:hypothetical protein